MSSYLQIAWPVKILRSHATELFFLAAMFGVDGSPNPCVYARPCCRVLPTSHLFAFLLTSLLNSSKFVSSLPTSFRFSSSPFSSQRFSFLFNESHRRPPPQACQTAVSKPYRINRDGMAGATRVNLDEFGAAWVAPKPMSPSGTCKAASVNSRQLG